MNTPKRESPRGILSRSKLPSGRSPLPHSPQAPVPLEDFVSGPHAVFAELSAKRRKILRAYIATTSRREDLESALRASGIAIKIVERDALDALAGHDMHKGIIAELAPYPYMELEALCSLGNAGTRKIVILDELKDPHNVGAILRTGVAAGFTGFIVQERRSIGITETVHRTSAGIAAHAQVARVTNIPQAIEHLKKSGFWIFGLDAAGQDYKQVDFAGRDVALVLGEEGHGLRQLVQKSCDVLLRIPMAAPVESLNVSVSFAVLAYHV